MREMSGVLIVIVTQTKQVFDYCQHGVNCFISGNEQCSNLAWSPQMFKRPGSKREITLQDPQGEGRDLQIA